MKQPSHTLSSFFLIVPFFDSGETSIAFPPVELDEVADFSDVTSENEIPSNSNLFDEHLHKHPNHYIIVIVYKARSGHAIC